jgi:hypothetical protein
MRSSQVLRASVTALALLSGILGGNGVSAGPVPEAAESEFDFMSLSINTTPSINLLYVAQSTSTYANFAPSSVTRIYHISKLRNHFYNSQSSIQDPFLRRPINREPRLHSRNLRTNRYPCDRHLQPNSSPIHCCNNHSRKRERAKTNRWCVPGLPRRDRPLPPLLPSQ